MAKEPSDFKARLKKADPAIRRYVVELQKRNAKLHTEIVKLEAEKIDRKNRIKALEKGETHRDLGERLRRAREREKNAGLVGSVADLVHKKAAQDK